jgi:hypothetical protein
MTSFRHCFGSFSAGTVSLLILLGGCTQRNEALKNDAKGPKGSMVFNKPGASYSQTMIISSATAVFFNPDSIQLERFQALNSEMIFKSTIHECFYQQKNAKKAIHDRWRTIEVKNADTYRYLLFVKKSGDTFLVDLDSLDLCGLFLFDPDKDPVQADMMNIETALADYFKSN